MFTSRTLKSVEVNYSQTEKEALAIIFTVQKFHQYICERPAMIQTDHKPPLGLLGEHKSIHLENIKVYPAWQQPEFKEIILWEIILSTCDYKLCYCLVNENKNADCMSRLHFNNEPYEKHSVIGNHLLQTELIDTLIDDKL